MNKIELNNLGPEICGHLWKMIEAARQISIPDDLDDRSGKQVADLARQIAAPIREYIKTSEKCELALVEGGKGDLALQAQTLRLALNNMLPSEDELGVLAGASQEGRPNKAQQEAGKKAVQLLGMAIAFVRGGMMGLLAPIMAMMEE